MLLIILGALSGLWLGLFPLEGLKDIKEYKIDALSFLILIGTLLFMLLGALIGFMLPSIFTNDFSNISIFFNAIFNHCDLLICK